MESWALGQALRAPGSCVVWPWALGASLLPVAQRPPSRPLRRPLPSPPSSSSSSRALPCKCCSVSSCSWFPFALVRAVTRARGILLSLRASSPRWRGTLVTPGWPPVRVWRDHVGLLGAPGSSIPASCPHRPTLHLPSCSGLCLAATEARHEACRSCVASLPPAAIPENPVTPGCGPFFTNTLIPADAFQPSRLRFML